MKRYGRWGLLAQLFFGLFLLFSAALSNNTLMGILAALYIALVGADLRSPKRKNRFQKQFAALQAQGLYPLLSEASDDDVRRLLHAGHRLFAIRLYRDLHQVSLKQAITAVKQMN